jgi:hypothetical protein
VLVDTGDLTDRLDQSGTFRERVGSEKDEGALGEDAPILEAG